MYIKTDESRYHYILSQGAFLYGITIYAGDDA